MRRRVDDVRRQYEVTDPLKVRIETHRLYQERKVDLDSESEMLLELGGNESLLDVGCGPGRFLLHLRRDGHIGRLAGLDQSFAMIAEARSSIHDAGFEFDSFVGDAMDLPFDEHEFEWVVARHMLYHVPDIQQALAELSRVTKCGVLVSTNGLRNLPKTVELIDDLLIAFGLTPVQMPSDRFCIDNADAIFAKAGLNATVTIIENALVFRHVEPIVDYVLSSVPSFELSDESLIRDMEDWLRLEIRRRLDDLGGIWRDPTRVGLYMLTNQ